MYPDERRHEREYHLKFLPSHKTLPFSLSNKLLEQEYVIEHLKSSREQGKSSDVKKKAPFGDCS